MPTYLHPAVFIEELAVDQLPPVRDPGRAPDGLTVRSSWIAEHGTAAFLGRTSAGPMGAPIRIDGVEEFRERFEEADPVRATGLAGAVEGFFANGGHTCHVVKVEAYALDEVSDGLAGLERVPDLSTIALPDLMAAHAEGWLDLETAHAVQLGAIAHCELMGDRVVLLDAPAGLSAEHVRDWRQHLARYDSRFAALFWPWLRARGSGDPALVPPSGHVAGLLARVDRQYGPHRSPLREPVRAAGDVETDTVPFELDVLIPQGINVLARSAPGEPVVAGGRTLSSDPVWRFLASRRLMAFISRNLRSGTAWALGERAGDPDVWAQLQHDVDGLFRLLWQSGALVGSTPEDAYSVRCDDGTNGARIDAPNMITLEGGVRLDAVSTVGFNVRWITG